MILDRLVGRARVKPSLRAFLFTIGLVSFAQKPPDQAFERERTLRAISFTSEKLSIWQKRLNLQDWDISIVLARTADLKPHTLGHIRWDPESKVATISVLNPTDYRLPQDEMLRDMEFTIVHELIHLNFGLVLSEVRRTEANRQEEEQVVNLLADVLLKLDGGMRRGVCDGVKPDQPQTGVSFQNDLRQP
jgi:hypothetical protein